MKKRPDSKKKERGLYGKGSAELDRIREEGRKRREKLEKRAPKKK